MTQATTSASSCDRKVAYDTIDAAQTHLDLLRLCQDFGGARAYRCDFCGRFHIAGRPAHVYGGGDPHWHKRQRKKARRRRDDADEPVAVGRMWFVGEINEMLGDEWSDESEEPALAAGGLLITRLFDPVPATGVPIAREREETIGVDDAQETNDIPAEAEGDTIGHPGAKFAWVPANEIRVDPDYQRDVAPARVTDIATNFQPITFGVVYLSKRDDGALYAIDGQHRIAAVEARYGPHATKRVPAFVLADLTPEREAEIYYVMNRMRLNASAYDAFKARLRFDPEAQAVKKILDDRGLILLGGTTTMGQTRFNEVFAVATLESLYRAHWLEDVLDLIRAAWEGKPAAHRANYLKGIRTFLETFWDEFYGDATPARLKTMRRERLIDTLAALGPNGLDDKAAFYADAIGARTHVGMARGVHAAYNRNARANTRLPVWGETGIEGEGE